MQPGQLNVPSWCNPNVMGEAAVEVKSREICDAPKALDRQGLVQMSVDEIQGPTESLSIAFLAIFTRRPT